MAARLLRTILLLYMLLGVIVDVFGNSSMRDPFNSKLSIGDGSSTNKSFVIALHYVDSDYVALLLEKRKQGLLSKSGNFIVDKRSNRIWVTDDGPHIKNFKSLIRSIDTPSQKILIKARIISIDDSSLSSLGFIFSSQSKKNASYTEKRKKQSSSNIDIGSIVLPILSLSKSIQLDLEINALEQKGRARVISKPIIMTNNRELAVIESGDEIPYQERSGEGNTNVAFKKAVLRLQVTPEVMPGDNVLLKLVVNQDKISSFIVNGVPAIRTQQLSTQVLVHNQQMLVLGGIFEQASSRQDQGVPFFAKNPVGGIFVSESSAFTTAQTANHLCDTLYNS